MVKSWRKYWNKRTHNSTNLNFPFGFVQLANAEVETESVGYWPVIRWHQTANVGYAPNEKLNNVFMTTAVDLVDNTDDAIHPRFKQDIGLRLAKGAFNLGYNMNVEYLPPIVKSVKFGDKVEIEFDSDFKPVEFNVINQKGFDVCCHPDECANNDWIKINSFEVNGNILTIKKPSTDCSTLRSVRYLWRQKPCEFKSCSLYSKRTNLPVYPFIASRSFRINGQNLIVYFMVLFYFIIL